MRPWRALRCSCLEGVSCLAHPVVCPTVYRFAAPPTQTVDLMKNLPALMVVLLAGITASGCGARCRNEPIAVVPSPSGKSEAVVFHRNCGATTGPNTQVAVIPSYSDLPNIPGNALVLDAEVPLEVRWLSDSSLSVSGLGSVRASRQQESVAGVSIAYGE